MAIRGISLNQEIASKIEAIATTAIHALTECKGKEVTAKNTEEDVTDAQGLDDTLRKQEGALSRRATVLGPESLTRYKKGVPVHDASGKFRRSDAKG